MDYLATGWVVLLTDQPTVSTLITVGAPGLFEFQLSIGFSLHHLGPLNQSPTVAKMPYRPTEQLADWLVCCSSFSNQRHFSGLAAVLIDGGDAGALSPISYGSPSLSFFLFLICFIMKLRMWEGQGKCSHVLNRYPNYCFAPNTIRWEIQASNVAFADCF